MAVRMFVNVLIMLSAFQRMGHAFVHQDTVGQTAVNHAQVAFMVKIVDFYVIVKMEQLVIQKLGSACALQGGMANLAIDLVLKANMGKTVQRHVTAKTLEFANQ